MAITSIGGIHNITVIHVRPGGDLGTPHEGTPHDGTGRGEPPTPDPVGSPEQKGRGDTDIDHGGNNDDVKSKPGGSGGSGATSTWPTAYALERLPTRYGPSKDDPNIMVDYEHPGDNRFIIRNDQAYPVKTDNGQTSIYDSQHPERPAYPARSGADGQWQVSLGLKGGDDPRLPAPPNRNDPGYQPPPHAGGGGANAPQPDLGNVLALGAPAPGFPGMNLGQWLAAGAPAAPNNGQPQAQGPNNPGIAGQQ
ncbi:hypothetical protein [Paraburkholderia aromaticivorans]|uniref:hypothetical protein n=1 Tax=Paraburkholderia aromaticivorans TaxID=2026199 RepID=UPI001455EBFF|nr:hypothetical protein [Paraburkholderia aromaticivorans]